MYAVVDAYKEFVIWADIDLDKTVHAVRVTDGFGRVRDSRRMAGSLATPKGRARFISRIASRIDSLAKIGKRGA